MVYRVLGEKSITYPITCSSTIGIMQTILKVLVEPLRSMAPVVSLTNVSL